MNMTTRSTIWTWAPITVALLALVACTPSARADDDAKQDAESSVNSHASRAAAKAQKNASAVYLATTRIDWLERAKAQIGKQDKVALASYDALKKRADRALKTEPRSVTHKTTTPPSGSKHDYISMGPYWWPDPSKKDGLPYIRKDGQRNPEVAGNGFDSDRLVAMANDMRDLSLMAYLSGEKKYAEHATKVLQTWFIDPKTRMNPNLRFGQAILGIVEGRGTGLIDSRHFAQVIDAVQILAQDKSITKADFDSFQKWIADFAQWMTDSDIGQEEYAAYNNHGMFYDAQLAIYQRFAGQQAKARRVTFNSITLRIMGQIDRNGMLPHELERTRPFHYTAFSLLAAAQLAHQADALDAAKPEHNGLGVAAKSGASCSYRLFQCPMGYWDASVDGRSLKRAVVEVAKVINEPSTWKHATKIESAPPQHRALPLLLMANASMAPQGDPDITKAIEKLRAQGGTVQDDGAWLLWPQ
jgi:hypothetical protein